MAHKIRYKASPTMRRRSAILFNATTAMAFAGTKKGKVVASSDGLNALRICKRKSMKWEWEERFEYYSGRGVFEKAKGQVKVKRWLSMAEKVGVFFFKAR